jgi:hypothetical protein
MEFMAPKTGSLTGVVERLNSEGENGWQVIHVQHFDPTHIEYTLMKEIENA